MIARRNLGTKISTGPKKRKRLKKIKWVEGSIAKLKFTQKKVKHWFDTIHLFSLIILVYICNRSCPENRFCTITHLFVKSAFSNYILNIYIQDVNSIFNSQSITWGNKKKMNKKHEYFSFHLQHLNNFDR